MNVVPAGPPLHGATPLYTAAGTRALDQAAIEGHGIPGYLLMSRAGERAFLSARARWPEARRWQIYCGAGNNAGDGYVIARLAREHGIDTVVTALVDPERLRGDAATAFAAFRDGDGSTTPWTGEPPDAELVIDALLGTGLDRPVEGAFAAAIAAINASGRPVVAIDIPSGLAADSGGILGNAVRAVMTVTFIGGKQGLFTGQGRACTGELVFDPLGVPRKIYGDVAPSAWLLDQRTPASYLPARAPDTHKGSFGFVAVVGGDRGMPGAVQLAGEASLRTGAGMTRVATHPDHASLIPLSCPPLMAAAVADARAVAAVLDWASVLALGPGLGQSDWSEAVFEAGMASDLPCVVDADGLNWLAARPRRRDDWVLTPHPGEAARLLDRETVDIQVDRFGAAREIQARYGGTCVLKGSGTIIAAEHWTAVCQGGNPGMATAGMGDVLTGVIAALIAQGLTAEEAAAVGACVHAAAGDRAAGAGERGLIATDVIGELRAVVNPGA
ncbi:MAG: NAD(P)H-hydrate dehydratase [Pseudomonadota bacterium]